MNSDSARSRIVSGQVHRRNFIKAAAGSAGLAAVGPWVLDGSRNRAARTSAGVSGGPAATAPTVNIGYIGSFSGLLAPDFKAAANYVARTLQQHFNAHGLVIGGKRHNVSITTLDTGGSEALAVENVDYLYQHGADLILVHDSAPVAAVVGRTCQSLGVPCISTGLPWETWFLARGGKLGGTRAKSASWKWSYHFFWGLADVEPALADMWGSLATDKAAGGLWPNNDDLGIPYGNAKTGFPALLEKRGYTVKAERYPDGGLNSAAAIAAFESAKAQILTGTPAQSDFMGFWKSAAAYQPEVVSLLGTVDYPADVQLVNKARSAVGLSCGVWWAPTFPYRSSITGQTSAELAAAYTSAEKLQWSQAVGSTHALYEVACAALVKAGSTSRGRIATALSTLSHTTIVGPVNWSAGPVKNVSTTIVVGGQWRKAKNYPFDLVVVSNKTHSKIPVGGKLQAISYT
jgi:branched-chain amino acid transport system substrate-binding protein